MYFSPWLHISFLKSHGILDGVWVFLRLFNTHGCIRFWIITVYSHTSNALWCQPYYTIVSLSIIIKIAIWWHLILICLSLITWEVEHFSQIYELLVFLVLLLFLDLFYGCCLLITHTQTHTQPSVLSVANILSLCFAL